MNLRSKVFIVSGGTSGIGRAVAERLAHEGAAVVIGGRRRELGEQVAAAISTDGGEARFAAVDATVERDAAALVETAVRAYGRLDGAFNNAGGVAGGGALTELSEADWRRELDLNVSSVFFGLKHQIPAMRGVGGAILTNASVAGVGGVPGLAAYTAAKHAVVGLTKAAALETARLNIRVNALVTGNVDTPLYRRLLGAGPDDPIEAPNPTGRVADAAEIAAFVAFLFSDEARFITGAALAVDGGSTAG